MLTDFRQGLMTRMSKISGFPRQIPRGDIPDIALRRIDWEPARAIVDESGSPAAPASAVGAANVALSAGLDCERFRYPWVGPPTEGPSNMTGHGASFMTR